MTSREFQDALKTRADAAGVSLTPDLAVQLESYYRLLATWNQKINLTGLDLRQLEAAALDRLLIEPVAAARYAQAGEQVMDVGSGGGSPAIPFALAAPPGHLLMVESRSKKAVFLREAARVVGLRSAEVETARFEDLLRRPEFLDRHGVVTVRAVRVDPAMLLRLAFFVRPGGRIFLFRTEARGGDSAGGPLVVEAVHMLVPALRSELTILRRGG